MQTRHGTPGSLLGALSLGLLVGLGIGRITSSEVGRELQASPTAEMRAEAESAGEPLTSARARRGASEEAGPAMESRRSAVEAAFAPLQPDAALAGLAAEFERLLDSGALHRRLEEEPRAMGRFLMSQCLALGDVDGAWAIAASDAVGGELWAALAEMLQDEHPQRSCEAWRIEARLTTEQALAGEESGRDLSWSLKRRLLTAIEGIASIAPREALALAESVQASLNLDELLDQESVARLLVDSGRTSEAFELFDRGLDSPYMSGETLWTILDLDSATAEEFLRRRLESDPSDADLSACLANVLIRNGEEEQGQQLLLDLLDSNANVNPDLITDVLDSLPMGEFSDRWAEWIADPECPLNSDSRSNFERRLIESLIEQGRAEEAIEQQVAALERFASDENWLYEIPSPAGELFAMYPDRIVPALRGAEGRARLNDELWGDLGDMYWQAGYSEDARRCWVQAWELDRTDSEWIGNLKALDAGQDPHH